VLVALHGTAIEAPATRPWTARIETAGPAPEHAPVRIGRSSENDVRLPFSDVSRVHAQLQWFPGRDGVDGMWWITDLRSSGGTWVNGCRLVAMREHAPVRPGDTITFGSGPAFRFEAGG
jgi:pSer/pThr/pTyr-binding forkhead associated (FHA) protein